MHKAIFSKFGTLVESYQMTGAANVLEIGAHIKKGLLSLPVFSNSNKVGLNLKPFKSSKTITMVKGNSNDMSMFKDNEFDVVLSNATLEHDKYFWKSIAEMRRILAVGGLMIIGVPGYDGTNTADKSVPTYMIHDFPGDYYRYSKQSCKEIFFDGFKHINQTVFLHPPRIVTAGILNEHT